MRTVQMKSKYSAPSILYVRILSRLNLKKKLKNNGDLLYVVQILKNPDAGERGY